MMPESSMDLGHAFLVSFFSTLIIVGVPCLPYKAVFLRLVTFCKKIALFVCVVKSRVYARLRGDDVQILRENSTVAVIRFYYNGDEHRIAVPWSLDFSKQLLNYNIDSDQVNLKKIHTAHWIPLLVTPGQLGLDAVTFEHEDDDDASFSVGKNETVLAQQSHIISRNFHDLAPADS